MQGGGDGRIRGKFGQNILAGSDETSQVSPVVLFLPEVIIIAEAGTGSQGMEHGLVECTEVRRIQGSAPVTEVVQIITDGLVSNDETGRFIEMGAGQEGIYCASFAVKHLCLYAHDGLPAQLRIRN